MRTTLFDRPRLKLKKARLEVRTVSKNPSTDDWVVVVDVINSGQRAIEVSHIGRHGGAEGREEWSTQPVDARPAIEKLPFVIAPQSSISIPVEKRRDSFLETDGWKFGFKAAGKTYSTLVTERKDFP